MDNTTEIYLAKPNGQKEGPFTLDQINLALAARKYRSGDYWAWHKGLPEWVPLYDIEGIIKVSSLAASLATQTPEPTRDSAESSGDRKPNETEPCLAATEPPENCPSMDLGDFAIPGSIPELSPAEAVKETAEQEEPATAAIQEAEEQPREKVEFANSGVEDSISSLPEDTAETDDEATETAPPVPHKLEELLAETSTEEHVEVNAAPGQPTSLELDPEQPEQHEPVESLSTDETPQISKEIDAITPEKEEPDASGAAVDTGVEQFPETNEPVEAEAGLNDSIQPAQPSAEEAEVPAAGEPLSADETSHIAKTEAHELVDKAETAASILARLKQNFFHTAEPANGVTSYFNARRSPLPGVVQASTPQLGSEFGMPEASHPLDFHSKAVPKVPEQASAPGPESDPAAALLAQQFSSGMPFAALEQLFIFTTGDGRSIWGSPVMARMLEAIIGEKLERIRQGTPRDVIFNCDLSQLLKRDGAISDAVWHAMAIREPSVVERAQKKLSRTCVRTFNLETDTVVALVLFYNNQKLENIPAVLGRASSSTTRFTLPASAKSPGSPHPQ